MNNTDKLLRAFIEASGYEVEEVKGRLTDSEKNKVKMDAAYLGMKSPCDEFLSMPTGIDYKVTKKPFDILSDDYTDEVMRLHKTIQETNTYNEELYKESLRLKKVIAGLIKNDNS